MNQNIFKKSLFDGIRANAFLNSPKIGLDLGVEANTQNRKKIPVNTNNQVKTPQIESGHRQNIAELNYEEFDYYSKFYIEQTQDKESDLEDVLEQGNVGSKIEVFEESSDQVAFEEVNAPELPTDQENQKHEQAHELTSQEKVNQVEVTRNLSLTDEEKELLSQFKNKTSKNSLPKRLFF